MNEIIMYTDGSCLKNPDGPGGCAVILLYDKNGKPYEKRKSIPNESTTNNKMEIMAVITGLQMVLEPSDIKIYSDSKYVVDAFHKKWVQKWQRINWDRGENGGVVKNVDLWKKLLSLLEPHTYQFFWVKGHQGKQYNELCDQMAVEAAKSQKGKYYEGVVREDTSFAAAVKDRKPLGKIQISCKKAEWDDIKVERLLLEKRFLIMIQGSYDGKTKTGQCKYLLNYENFARVYTENVGASSSVNDVLLQGIEQAVSKIRYKQKPITIITANNLGFKNPEKSIHASTIRKIYQMAAENENVLEVIEAFGATRQIKNTIKNFEV